jgi:microcystin-dependent protein
MRLKKVALGLVLICVASLLLYPAITVQAFEETGINNNTLATAETSVPIGTVIAFAGAVPPKGYLLCDGTSYSRITYEDLYAVIGTIYGSLDGATFKVPDLRGEFLRGVDSGRGIDTGRALGSSQADELKSHTHRIIGSAGGENTDAYNPSTGVCSANSYYGIFGGGIENTGGSETRPRNVAINYCIKY